MRDWFRRERALKPIYDRESYAKGVDAMIAYNLYRDLFKPLFALLRPAARTAAKVTATVEALTAGRIAYADGFFVGQFSAAVSRELRALGATFNATRKAYKLALPAIPIEVKQAIAAGKLVARERADAMLAHLDTVSRAPALAFEDSLASMMADLDTQFHATTVDLSVPLTLTPPIARRLQDEYVENLDLGIQHWQDEAVARLRGQIATSAAEGFRADRMAKVLEAEYGATQSKAKFLARQETSLFVSKYREARYTEAGITRYRWSTSNDERVRSSHRALNKRVFSWDNPPIIDPATGRRGHPGEDFGPCRCLAIPMVRIPRQ